jgi:dTMP kinase
MARATVRGADSAWVRGVYEFALKPDLVVYLRATVEQLVTRVVQGSGFNYWESGMDLRLGDDLYDSFVAYQSRLLTEFDRMTEEYGFQVVDTSANILTVSEEIRGILEPMLLPCVTPAARRRR